MKEIKILLTPPFKFIKIDKNLIVILLIILIGAFLRLYNFEELLRFNNDQARDMQILEQIKSGEAVFLGPKAGGTKFNLGPAFYYMEYLSGLIFGFSPTGIAFFIPILSIISIYLFYLLFKKIFSTDIALGLTFLYAISFYGIKYSHFAWNPNAIPFFVLSFLLLLSRMLEKKDKWYDYVSLGIVIGIGTQLHTTLLIAIPFFVLFFFIWLYLKKYPISLRKITLLVIIAFSLNLSFIYGDIINNGENVREFLAGTQTKTENNISISKNISADIQFFLQGSAYQLTGFEPQKNWINLIKLVRSKNIAEIFLFLSSLFIFLFGIILIIKEKKKNKITLLLSSFAILLFLLFLPLGDELNIRFFILLQFLPYLLVGLIAQSFIQKNFPKKITCPIIIFFILLIIAANLSIYQKAYNLKNYSAPEGAYGGISWGELDEICSNIKKISNNTPTGEIYIENFEYKRSLEYTCKRQDARLNFISSNEVKENMNFFVIIENKNLSKNIEKYQEKFIINNPIKIKRFNLLYLLPKNQ